MQPASQLAACTTTTRERERERERPAVEVLVGSWPASVGDVVALV